jgi:RNA polymerase sigma-70 factor (ECF subfamily)
MPGQPAEDHQLLKQAQQGDAEAFGALYERHAAAIFRYLFVHLSSRSDAEDLTSEVFLRAWQSLPRYQQRGVPFRAFLFRIAHNALVDQYRQGQHAHPQVQENDPAPLEDMHSPDETLIGEMDRQELSRLLAGLRADYRTVLVLRFLSQLSPVETAAVMQRTPGAVRILQHRALEALRQKLLEQKVDEV